jgi:hypothetical protein
MLYSGRGLARYSLRIAMKAQALGISVLLLGAAGVANADQADNHRGAGQSHDWFVASADRGDKYRVASESHNWFRDRSAPALQAPEIDRVSMVAALTLLGGAFAVLHGRRPRAKAARIGF